MMFNLLNVCFKSAYAKTKKQTKASRKEPATSEHHVAQIALRSAQRFIAIDRAPQESSARYHDQLRQRAGSGTMESSRALAGEVGNPHMKNLLNLLNAMQSCASPTKRAVAQLGSALECDLSDLECWVDHKLNSVRKPTVGAYLFAFELFLAWCERERIVEGNIAKYIEPLSYRRPFRRVFGNVQMVKTLIDECQDPALKFILFCGFHAGLRKAEIVASRPEWFDVERKLVTVTRCDQFDTKDGEDRTIPLTEDFLAYLRVYKTSGVYMLYNWHKKTTGTRYRYDFRTKYRKYMDSQALRHGFVRLTIHDMRRTFASVLVSSRKCTIYEIARWLGDDLRVVERHYGHLQPHDGSISLAFG
jgi:integrase